MLKGPVREITSTQGIGSPARGDHGRPDRARLVHGERGANTAGPTEIRHRERERTVTLEIVPSPRLALERAIEIIRGKVIAPLRKAGPADRA